MRKIKLVLATSIALMMSSNASAAYCTGTISHTITYASGNVMFSNSWRSDWTTVCNVKEEWKGVSPEVCYLWFSHISSAITENKSLTVWYPTLGQTECATMPTYSNSPAPGYIMIAK